MVHLDPKADKAKPPSQQTSVQDGSPYTTKDSHILLISITNKDGSKVERKKYGTTIHGKSMYSHPSQSLVLPEYDGPT